MNFSMLPRRAALGFPLLVLLLVGAVAVGVLHSDGDSTRDAGSVTAQEIDQARATLAADAGWRAAVRGAEWRVTQATRDSAKGSTAGIGLVLELAAAVDSDGPWKQLRCQGTVSEQYAFGYTGVQMVGAVVSRDGTKVLAFQPLPSVTLSFNEGDVARQSTLTPCPRGYEDPEN